MVRQPADLGALALGLGLRQQAVEEGQEGRFRPGKLVAPRAGTLEERRLVAVLTVPRSLDRENRREPLPAADQVPAPGGRPIEPEKRRNRPVRKQGLQGFDL